MIRAREHQVDRASKKGSSHIAHLFGDAWSRQPTYPLGDAHPPNLDAQVDHIVSAVGIVLICEVEGGERRRLEVALLVGVLVANLVGQDALAQGVPLGGGGGRLGHVPLELALQGPLLLLDLGEAQLARFVQPGPDVEAIARRLEAVDARRRCLAAFQLALSTFQAALLFSGLFHSVPALWELTTTATTTNRSNEFKLDIVLF